MKMTDKYIFYILTILAIGLFLIVYFVPCKNVQEETDSLKSQNSSLISETNELQKYHDNKAQYESDAEVLKKEIQNILISYPSSYRPEDFIMEAVSMQTAAPQIVYDSINITEPESLALLTVDKVKEVGIEDLNEPIEFLYQRIDYNNELNYFALKDAIADVFSSPYRLNINNITYQREKDSGKLKGSISLGYYYVTGNGRDYEAPDIPEYNAGVLDLFNGNWQFIGDGYYGRIKNDE